MADKKITDLTELTALSQDDLLVVVDSPGGTPITKKITAANLFANVNFLTTVSVPAAIAVGAVLTANANTTAAGTMLAAGKFVTNALPASANTPYQYGVYAESTLSGAAANVVTEHAAGKFKLDVSNAAALVVNTYGVVVEVANTGTRAAQPTAFFNLKEQLNATNALSTKYLFVANLQSNLTSISNITSCFSVSNGISTISRATHKLRIQIDGVDYFILCSDTASAAI